MMMGSYNARLFYPIGYSRCRCGAIAALIRQPQTHPHNVEPEIRNRILWEGARLLGVGEIWEKLDSALTCVTLSIAIQQAAKHKSIHNYYSLLIGILVLTRYDLKDRNLSESELVKKSLNTLSKIMG